MKRRLLLAGAALTIAAAGWAWWEGTRVQREAGLRRWWAGG